MKREDLLRHPRLHGCYLKRKGGSHSLWMNLAVPRHNEVAEMLAKGICKRLGLSDSNKR